MKNLSFFSNFVILFSALLLICHSSQSDSKFECLGKTGNVPELPKAYSTNIKINFINEEYTVELKYAKNRKGGKELFEFISKDRHVKYIAHGDDAATLYIEYQKNKVPKCEVTKSTYIKDFLKVEDSGEGHFMLKVLEVMVAPSEYKIYSTGPAMDTGVYAVRYEGCLKEPKMNISFTFAVKNWKMSHASVSSEVNYPELLEAQIGDKIIQAYYSNFDPSEPDDAIFQPPPDMFCKGFRTRKAPPKMPNYFSYGAELVNYQRVEKGPIVPLVSQRKVYYDYKDNIARIDFNDLLAPDTDSFTETTAQKKSIIHDYNSGVQYIIDSFSGKCSIDTFVESFTVFTYELTKNNRMYNGAEFFWLDNTNTSYNGQFHHRGVMADVYTDLRIDSKTRDSYIISWFFSTETTQVAENENVEKNVLLSMYVRPETEARKEMATEIHFFNFLNEEPEVFDFDLTNCYNETTSKTLVFTFPAYDELRGSEKLVGRLLNIALKDVTGVRKHRVFTREVIFFGKYMYAEFSLLEDSPTGPAEKKISLEDALNKLYDSVSKGDFSVDIQHENKTILLKAESRLLNVFSGNRPKISNDEGYTEGSVIGLTIGMLLLGFVLGMVAVNMIISRKHGVSLLGKSRFGGSGFQNPSYESSM